MDLELLEEILESSDTDTELSLFDSSSSSPSDSEAEEGVAGVTDFLETIKNFSEGNFKEHFRLNRSTANRLIEIYENSEGIGNRQRGGRKSVGADKEIYIFLWYIANTKTFRELANLFNISKSTAWHVIVRVADWLVTIAHQYIRWPSVAEIPHITSRNETNKKIPGVLGAIDCTHINVVAPVAEKECYFNRKREYSIHLQAVVGLDKKFMDVFVGEPGSLHDGRVLRRSEIYREAMSSTNRLFPGNTFILGDSAYPLMDWLIPPYRDNNQLTSEQRQFNFIHSSARIRVEHSFGLLKKRFRRLLHFTENIQLALVVNLTVAACVLHNMCIDANDSLEVEFTHNIDDTESVHDNSVTVPGNRRDILLTELINKNVIKRPHRLSDSSTDRSANIEIGG